MRFLKSWVCFLADHKWEYIRINKFQAAYYKNEPFADEGDGVDRVCLRCGKERLECDPTWGYKLKAGMTPSPILQTVVPYGDENAYYR